MYDRILDLQNLINKKSLFLFGPRSTGKTTLLRKQFDHEAIINLLRSSTFLSLSEKPSRLREIVNEISRKSKIIIIDEIQKLPELLDEVHDLIETTGLRFILTGSSGRKLKRSGVNLLAGRAWQTNLFPLTSAEIPDFDIGRYLLYGGLPQVYGSDYPEEELDAYVDTYLKEEIKQEALVQNFIHFSRFLNIAAVVSTEQLNYANVSRDTGVPVTSVRSYFEILSDTFIGFILEPWRESKKRKAISTSKFYFFDVGVANFLKSIQVLNRNSSEFGTAFENFIAMELRSYLSYRRIKLKLTYWRTRTGYEVDFLVGSKAAIEVKSTENITDKHLKGIRALAEEKIVENLYIVSFDELNRQTQDGIHIVHWRTFLTEMWTDLMNW
ncbi:MAG: ATP-binding protein [Spirochaetales bacterium]|nr:ATP-binding protein [Spirochaetales bacterium]